MEIKQHLVPKTAKGRRPGTKMVPAYITIHSNANLASTAMNEADNICNNSPEKQVSFHFVVDDKEAIQTMPCNEIAWHAGDGAGGTGNMKSIGIEICEGGNRILAINNAVALVKQLMEEHNIDINHVTQHHNWSGKDCPRILRNPAFIKKPLDWNFFISQLGEKKEHWAKKNLESLVKKGIINSPEAHSDLDKLMTKGEVFAMIDRITDIKK